MKSKINKFAYCKKCKKTAKAIRVIKYPLYKRVWFITIISSLGLALPVFIIYHYFVKKKIYCEKCFSMIKFYDSPDKIPGTKEQIVRIVNNLEDNLSIFCLYCHEEIDKKSNKCPSCKANL
jgi:hypothetical protein